MVVVVAVGTVFSLSSRGVTTHPFSVGYVKEARRKAGIPWLNSVAGLFSTFRVDLLSELAPFEVH